MQSAVYKLAKYLADDPNAIGTGDITWIVGDFGMSSPTSLPFGYVVPFDDKTVPRTGGVHGVDDHTYTIPILIVDDLLKYGDPVDVDGEAYQVQPGYQRLFGYRDDVTTALRRNITLDGAVATSRIAEARFVPLVIDSKPYRAARLALVATQRVGR